MKKYLKSFNLAMFLSCIVIIFAFSANTFANCQLRAEIYSADNGSRIKNANIALENIETNKVYKPLIKKDEIFFNNLENGEYKIIPPVNYKVNNDNPVIICELLVKDWNFLERVILAEKKSTDDRFVIGDADTAISVSKNKDKPISVNKRPLELRTCKWIKEKQISCGAINGIAEKFAKPEFPKAARAINASGAVSIFSIINEEGNVISAKAFSGHPLFHKVSEKATLNSKFKKVILNGKSVQISGTVIFYFNP